IVESNPQINKVYIYDRDESKKDLVGYWLKLFQDIRREKFDVVFDFSLNTSFGFLSMVCGISKRIGYDFRGRGRFSTDKTVLKGFENKHVVEYFLDLLALVGVPVENRSLEICVDKDSQQWAQNWVKSKNIDTSKPLFAIIPGAGASWGKDGVRRRWPVEKYASLADKIIAKSKGAIILMGDQTEKNLAVDFVRHCSYPVYDALGETSLLQMAALLQHCQLAIVNDGGPLHVAVAVGTKTVSIFGPQNPDIYGPYLPLGHIVIQKQLACQPCYRRFRVAQCDHLSCLQNLSVEEVYSKIEAII
ncbi:MAG: glycosyltransferase family 9 protein, partial [Candidatus Omnitrophota bacterium]